MSQGNEAVIAMGPMGFVGVRALAWMKCKRRRHYEFPPADWVGCTTNLHAPCSGDLHAF